MDWILFLVRTPVRAAVASIVVAAIVAYFWPGVVAHIVWVALSATVGGVLGLIWELKWLVLAGVAGVGGFFYARKFI